MSLQKVVGRTVVIGDEIYVVTCDKALPRHYTVAATMLLAMIVPQLLHGPTAPLLYAAFISLATLGLAWLFDDRDRYRLHHVIDINPARATDEPTTGATHES